MRTSDVVSEIIISQTGHVESDSSENKYMKTSIDLQEKRKDALFRFCQHASPIKGQVDYGEGFLYNDKHRVVYCRVPKVACSTWKRVLLIFEGAQKTLFEKHMREVAKNIYFFVFVSLK